ncbi:MAG TPA: hypothetical protein VGA22_10995 [Gemmatimonadales bacterium]
MASRYLVEHRHITLGDREFHFVSYEGEPAKPARNQPGTADKWFLVNAGYRREVMMQDPEHTPEDIDRLLTEWIEAHLLTEVSRV